MARLLLILALLATVFWVYSMVDCAVQPPIRHRGVPKAVWILIVIVFPVLGGILWFAIGRVRAGAVMNAPDDDPAFLNTLGKGRGMQPRADRTTPGSRADQDARIRELEEELARLDRDDDSDGDGRASGAGSGGRGGR